MARKKECGIYKITSPSGKCYVGSSAHMQKRFNEHRGHFQRGDHYNGKLRNAARKYGVEHMRFDVVLTCDRDVLRDLEQLTIDHVRPEYNIEQTVAKVLHDFWQDPEWRKKNSQRCTDQNIERWKEPGFREKYSQQMKAMHAKRPEIGKQAAERLKERWKCDKFRERMALHAGDAFRKLFSDPAYREIHSARQSALMKERAKCPDVRARLRMIGVEANKRPVFCVTLGRYFPSVGEAASELGVSVSLIGKQFRGKKTLTGWQWRYLADDELVERGYDPAKVRRDMPAPDKKIGAPKPCKPVLCSELGLAFPSAASAHAAFGLIKSGAIPCGISNGKNALGYKWEYILKDELSSWSTVTEFGGAAHLFRDSRSMPVRCVETGQIFSSVKSAAEKMQLGEKAYHGINDALRGRKKTSHGYHWERG